MLFLIMRNENLTASVSLRIDASMDKVWDALINPAIIRQYMFGAAVSSEWKAGSSIEWKGMMKDKPYEDKGTIMILEPSHTLQYTHYSPLTGLPDVPENYHMVTYELSQLGNRVEVVLTQDNNKSEQEKDHSAEMWQQMLEGLKKVVEKNG